MKPTVSLLCGLLLGLAIAACSAGPRKTAQPSSQDSGAGAAGLEGRPSEEIRDLDARISADLAAMGLLPPSDTEVTEMVVAHSVPGPAESGAAESCEAAPEGEGCGDVCTLADSICANADRICDLADQLPGDAWAVQRCASGRMSCERARTRCCDC